MKRSELKEAIKAEITSVLSEDINEIGFRPNTGLAQIKAQGEVDGADAITKELRQYNLKNVPDMDAYADGFVKGAASKAMFYKDKLGQAIRGGGDEESLMGLVGLNEESRFPTQSDIDDIENSGNIDIAYKKAMKLLKSLMNKSVSFSDIKELTENVNPDLERKIVDFVRKRANEYGIPVYNAFLSIEAKMAEMKDFFGEGKYSLEEDEAPAGDKKTEKAARGADKAKDDYAKLAGKDNTEISKASSLVKAKAKKAKEGDKEALNWLKTNQPKIKAYNDLKK